MGISASVQNLGHTTSNFPAIYRDGGGGGQINGLNLMWFSDGIYTTGGTPAPGNWLNFTSNSIACSNCDGKSRITTLQDFGTAAKGPLQQIPYFYKNGESDGGTAIWPNQNFATLCNGACGVGFPEVIDRDAIRAGTPATIGNTGVQIGLTAFGPVTSRPTQILFRRGEPLFGSFCGLAGVDGYLYMFARISQLANGAANGLKLARVPHGSWATRSAYQFWNGNAWVSRMPAYDDGGRANVFNWTSEGFGKQYGPGTGDVFWSPFYNAYMLIFQNDAAALDNNVYASRSSSLTGGWSAPVSIHKISTLPNGYSYALHALPNYDKTGKVVPLMWTEYQATDTYYIAMANVTFS